jgi:hypothetical protein
MVEGKKTITTINKAKHKKVINLANQMKGAKKPQEKSFEDLLMENDVKQHQDVKLGDFDTFTVGKGMNDDVFDTDFDFEKSQVKASQTQHKVKKAPKNKIPIEI